MLPEYVITLLKKHVSSTLYAIHFEGGKVNLRVGQLKHVLSDKIILTSNADNSNLELNYFTGDRLALLNIYNNNFIDLIRGKKPFTLEVKLKVKDIKTTIMKNIKQSIEKEVFVVSKSDTKIIANRGLFTNMGLMGVTIKPAPFYNTEENVFYRNIFSVYNAEGNDLLLVKLQQTQG